LEANDHYRGQVISVQDGDTITVRTEDFEQLRVRFYGIDCPEKKQAYGDEAKNYLYGLVYGKTVDLEVVDIDRYSRYVAIVRLGDVIINVVMVREGYAWLYEAYCKEPNLCNLITQAENEAKSQNKGLWQDTSPLEPWNYRRGNR
jgi:endonuclease YncB( thermonuclease family)